MNTGIQDACNLAWKLALVVHGKAGPALLASYDAERRPIGEEVVGRTVRHATRGMEADPEDPRTLMLREAQLLVTYRGGPLAAGAYGPTDAPQPGDRAPDCTGLTAPIATYPLRLLDLLRGRTGHVLLLYATDPAALAEAGETPGPPGHRGHRTPGRSPRTEPIRRPSPSSPANPRRPLPRPWWTSLNTATPPGSSPGSTVPTARPASLSARTGSSAPASPSATPRRPSSGYLTALSVPDS